MRVHSPELIKEATEWILQLPVYISVRLEKKVQNAAEHVSVALTEIHLIGDEKGELFYSAERPQEIHSQKLEVSSVEEDRF